MFSPCNMYQHCGKLQLFCKAGFTGTGFNCSGILMLIAKIFNSSSFWIRLQKDILMFQAICVCVCVCVFFFLVINKKVSLSSKMIKVQHRLCNSQNIKYYI